VENLASNDPRRANPAGQEGFDQSLLKKALGNLRLPVTEEGVSDLSARLQAIRDLRLPYAKIESQNAALLRICSAVTALIETVEAELAEDKTGLLPVLLTAPRELAKLSLIDYLHCSLRVTMASLVAEERGRQRPETTLFVSLYDLYADLTGRKQIGRDGPLYSFTITCARLLDDQIRDPGPDAFRGRLIKALKRRADLSMLVDKITVRMGCNQKARKPPI